MAGKIYRLPKEVSQSIAAGEVVERPASVVKELIENAIDACSAEITVELDAGGMKRIRVCDNGEGMAEEDVPLALQRYATSKIKEAKDLFAIGTLGFRGEALPSIASVSHVAIKTRVHDALTGQRAICEGGELKRVSELGCPAGTEIEVKDLFYNVPVRRKFLRSVQAELRQSILWFLRLALSQPSISFRFIHEGRTLYEMPRTVSPMARIEAVLGNEISEHLRLVEFNEGGIRVLASLSVPPFSRANGEGIYLFVNGRFIRDRIVYRALLEGYRSSLPVGRFPAAIVFIVLSPSAVDVNVHPTKAEVKFLDQEAVFRAVNSAVRSLVGRALDVTPTPEIRPESYPSPYTLPFPDAHEGSVREAPAPEWKPSGPIPFRILGQIRATYVVCEGEDGILVIDQHAAHEKIVYEKLRKEHEGRSISATRLLIPIQMELSPEEALILESHQEVVGSLGFEIDSMGARDYAIRSVPSWIRKGEPKEAVREMLGDLAAMKKEPGGEIVRTLLVTLACHSALRANTVLRREEMEELVAQIHPWGLSCTCPHGRPIFFSYSVEALRKEFRRR